ncbi:hypothetical protein ACGFI9_37180 [Micromonospora sp. NPDC048930]|uniref:hypothetical protein n=1 Tax=Micromonospora sp. NPDC048930 TaxID=3364261 RepID=UPI00372400B1
MSYATGDSLKVRIRIAFGASIAADPATWVWTDVTSWWHVDDDVQISWGRSSGAEQAERSTLALTLKNTDGRFTAMDPRSPYWPNVRKWTPISLDIDLGDGVGWRNRFSGFVRQWPLTWPGASSRMALAKIEAWGVLGRLARGKPPARSPMRRTIAATNPVAYWPAEDGATAQQASAGLPGGNPLLITGTVDIQSSGDYNANGFRYGTSTLVDVSLGASLSATLSADAAAATQSAWTVHVFGWFDVDVASGDIVLMEWTTPGGTYERWQLVAQKAALHTQVIGYNAAGAATVLVDRNGVLGGFRTWAVSAVQSGSLVNITYRLDDLAAVGASVTATLTGVTSVTVNPTGATATQPMPFGHLAVWDQADFSYGNVVVVDSYGGGVYPAYLSYRGEAATNRLARLAAEDKVPLAAIPAVDADAVTRMGSQKPGTPLELYQQVESADVGLLYESGFGLGYLPRAARYNAPVALTINGDAGQLSTPFEPVDDDQQLRNVWTIERDEGASAVAADDQSVDLQGEIEASVTLNLADDTGLTDQAWWRLHLTTVQEPRYPALSINLATHPELAAAWCGCRPGSRVQVINPPAQNVPGTVDQLVVGATETYRGRRSWKATLNVVPAAPWQVATADGEQRAAADGTTLTAGISATDTAIPITSTAANGRWTTDASDFPMDILVGGELVRLASITGTGLSQTATVVPGGRALNGVTRSWAAGTPVDVWQPAISPL